MNQDQGSVAGGPSAESVRIGTPERQAAVRDLSAHREAGRLTSQEYEDRTVRLSHSRTWGDLLPLFEDLPEPRPATLSDLIAARQAPVGAGHRTALDPAGGAGFRRWPETLVAVTPVLALALFFITGSWLWFLAIPLVGAAVYGPRRSR